MLFCMALIRLTKRLNKENIVFDIDKNAKLDHLLYMDDFKVFAKYEAQLQRALNNH